MSNAENGAPSATVEGAGAVRQGEELNARAVTAYLVSQGLKVEGEPEVSQFAGGASNLTYLLRYPQQDVIVRRPPMGHIAKSAHDVVREARIMTALAPVYP